MNSSLLDRFQSYLGMEAVGMLAESQTAQIEVRAAEPLPLDGDGRLLVARSCLLAVALSFISFAATFAALNPVVERAIPPRSFEMRVERVTPGAAVTEYKSLPVVEAAQSPPPAIHLVSNPAGASVRDSQGHTFGTTPMEVQLSGDSGRADFILVREGYRERHISLERRDESVVVVLAPEIASEKPR